MACYARPTRARKARLPSYLSVTADWDLLENWSLENCHIQPHEIGKSKTKGFKKSLTLFELFDDHQEFKQWYATLPTVVGYRPPPPAPPRQSDAPEADDTAAASSGPSEQTPRKRRPPTGISMQAVKAQMKKLRG